MLEAKHVVYINKSRSEAHKARAREGALRIAFSLIAPLFDAGKRYNIVWAGITSAPDEYGVFSYTVLVTAIEVLHNA
jgi:hypothetical protein